MRISDWSSDVCSSDLPQRRQMSRRFADVTDRFDQPGSNRAKALLAVERLPACRSVGKAFLFEQLEASPAGNPARWRQPFHEACPGQQTVGQCRPFAQPEIGREHISNPDTNAPT